MNKCMATSETSCHTYQRQNEGSLDRTHDPFYVRDRFGCCFYAYRITYQTNHGVAILQKKNKSPACAKTQDFRQINSAQTAGSAIQHSYYFVGVYYNINSDRDPTPLLAQKLRHPVSCVRELLEWMRPLWWRTRSWESWRGE